MNARATLIYDGACGFCRRWIERMRRWDRRRSLELVPYQTADLETRFPTLSQSECAQRIHLIDATGTIYRGAAAGREALRRLPGGWMWALPFYLPGGLRIADRVYTWITHRWGPLGGAHSRLDLPRSQAARTARVSALTSVLSARYLWTRLRALRAPRGKREAILDAYHVQTAEQVVQLMGNMKGALMKLGQIISFVSEDVPEPYRSVLSRLQTQSPPMSFELARQVIEADLGAPLRELFRDIEREPLAAASIGQVHRARLKSGDDVVVKVQYPGVAAAVRADLANLSWLYAVLGMMNRNLDPKPLADEVAARISEELDYAREARNQQAFAELYAGHPFIHVPAVFPAYSTPRVLTCSYVRGHGFDWLLAQPQPYQHRVGEILSRFVFGSIFRFRIFNADPHPGNYVFHEDGTVSFLDFGCVKYFPADMISNWAQLVRAHLAGDKQTFQQQAVRLGFLRDGTELSVDLYYDYIGYFYEPFSRDESFTYTPEYNARSVGLAFARNDPVFGEVTRTLNLPPDFALVNRLQWGLNSILSQLRATGNWHRMMREYLYGDPPSTELGRQSAAFRAAWKAARGIPAGAAVWMTPDGLQWTFPEEDRRVSA